MVDTYTKCVLTVIAGCLLVLAFGQLNLVTVASAGAQVGSDVQKVTLCNPDGDHCGDNWIQFVRPR